MNQKLLQALLAIHREGLVRPEDILILPSKRPLYMRNIVKVAQKSGNINLPTLIINLYPYWAMY